MSNTYFKEIQRIRKHFDDLQGLFQRYLPNVDPDLIYDLLTRLRENPSATPTYTRGVYQERSRFGKDDRFYVQDNGLDGYSI